MNANISNETRKRVYRRDHWRCAICDDTAGIQIHHVIHRSLGGTNAAHNLITLCWRCHARAHGTTFPGDAEIGVTREDVDQAAVEYLSDLYADFGLAWNPWEKELEKIADL